MPIVAPEELSRLLRGRRAIYPESYTNQPIPKTIIEEILENANWAPTHKRTEPWRFRVFLGPASRGRLADYLAEWYRAHTPAEQFSEIKYDKTRHNPQQSACVIAICLQRDPRQRLPEWEELAAVACAVQNMWLSCTAYGIGCYWSTPEAILSAHDFLELQPEEQCLGLLYMGYHQSPDLPGKRGPIDEKTTWYED